MHSARNVVEATEEKAADVAASAKSGMEKTKASMEEKAEGMTTRDPLQKEMAIEKKYNKKKQAQLNKQQAHEQNAAARQAAEVTGRASHMTTGTGPTRTDATMGSYFPAPD